MGFVDAEAAVAAFFRPKIELLGGRSVTEIPNPRPDIMVRTRRTGGTAANRRLDSPIVTVETWHRSRAEAAALAGEIRDLFYGSWGRRMEEVGGLYYDPDPASEVDRYSFSTRLWLPSSI